MITPSLTKTVPYVTGGFRSAAAMADAIRSGTCAGIGLARPAGSDPHLPTDLAAGKVGGATLSKLPVGDFGIQALAAGAQMEAIASGEPVFDLSDPKTLYRFGEAAKAFKEEMIGNMSKGVINPGFFVLKASE
jgi:hypothetical protein